MRRLVLPCLLAASAAALVHIPALKAGFVIWDDGAYVTENKDIRSLSPRSIASFFARPNSVGIYQPLVTLSYALDYRFSGLDPAGYHLVNILLHAVNAACVFLLLTVLGSPAGVPLAAALLFAVHPIHTEAAAWVSGRKEVLYSAFLLPSLILYASSCATRSRRSYLASLGCFVLALFAKPSAAAAPPLLFLLEWQMRKNGVPCRDGAKAPFFALAAACAALTLWLQHATLALDPYASIAIPFSRKVFFPCAIALAQVSRTLVPAGLSIIYPYPDPASSLPAFYYLAPFAVCPAALRLWRARDRAPHLFFGAAFFAAAVLPFLFLQFLTVSGPSITYDRYDYIPSIGLLYCLGYGFVSAVARTPAAGTARKALFAAAVLAVAACGAAAWRRTTVWQDDISLWSGLLARHPRVAIAWNNLALAHEKAGRPDLALRDWARALELEPRAETLHFNRGNLYSRLGQPALALRDYDAALALRPGYAEAWDHRGNACADLRDFPRALKDYDRALALKPESASAYNNRGTVRFALSDFQAAFADFTRAVTLDPAYALAWNNRGGAGSALGRPSLAIEDFTRAIAIDPSFANAYRNRMKEYQRIGRPDLAAADARTLETLGSKR